MSGYKRVNFYELCRLCATNQQKEKTHIFQEEGRKIQLQNKIQSCLSLKVCENDFLPKVVCSQCLRTLEECYTFRNECVSSETMLSSYFNNFRYTEDFKKSGKVYIKDIAPKQPPIPDSVAATGVVNTNLNVVSSTSYDTQQKNHEQFYTLQIPSTDVKAPVKTETQKLPNSIAYNLNTFNFAALKGIVQNMPKGETVGNIAVNTNGEILNITPFLDLESIIVNSSQKPVKQTTNPAKTYSRRYKTDACVRNENVVIDGGVIQIDLNQATNNEVKYEKLPHIKNTQNNKFTYTIKIDETSPKCAGLNQAVVVQPNVNLPISSNQGTFNQASFTTSQNNLGVNNSVVNSALNSMNNWNFTTNQTSTTSNMSVASSMSNVVAPSIPSNSNIPIVSNMNATAVCNTSVSSNISSNHLNIVNSSLGQMNTNGMNYTNPVTTNNSAWNVNSNPITTNLAASSSLNTSPGNLNNSNFTNSPHQSFNMNTTGKSPPGNLFVKKNRTPTSPTGPNLLPQNAPVKQEQQVQSKLFPCELCQKVFKRREHLYQHVKLHTGFRPFVCENCNKSFMRKEHLMRHMTSHSGLKNYTCDLCSKCFSRNDNLLKHKKTHDKQTSFTCEICQKQFVMKHYYLAHKLTHDNDKCVVPLWNILKT